MLAVADVADALMSARPYRAALPADAVLDVIMQGRGTEFCADCVDALRHTLRDAPASNPAATTPSSLQALARVE